MTLMTQQEQWTAIPQDVSMLPVQRQLVVAHTNFDRMAAHFMDAYGLTMPQFDIIATLGDQSGLTCKQLGEQSLTTKGSLLPILDRLEAKGLVRRCKGEHDSRQTIVSLTEAGQALYERVFPAFVAEMRTKVSTVLSMEEQRELIRLLTMLSGAFS